MSDIISNIVYTPSGRGFQYALYSHIGSRPVNEDSCAVQGGSFLTGFFLCDGLGGHGMGDQASQLVIRSLTEDIMNAADPDSFIPAAFENAQAKLLQEQKRLRAEQKMKTTATAVVSDGKKVSIGHIGDSRIYLWKRGKIRKRTLDHSVTQMMVLSHEIRDEEIRNHPDRSLLLRVMGTEWDEPKYEVMKPQRFGKYDAFLLCSDGFWELITEKEMEQCMKESSDTADWLGRMISLVFQNGAGKNMDNNTAIAVKILK